MRLLILALLIIPCMAWALDEQTVIDSSGSANVDTVTVVGMLHDTSWIAVDNTVTGVSLIARVRYNFPLTPILGETYLRFAGQEAIVDSAADTTNFVVNITGDTLQVYRKTAYEPFSDIQIAFAYIGQDKLYYDTLNFRTKGDTRFMVPKRYASAYGVSSSHTFTITGYRSPGMDVYCSESGSAIIEANDTTSVETAHRQWTYDWSVSNGLDSTSFWGVSDAGEPSDTVTVFRKYKQLFGFTRVTN